METRDHPMRTCFRRSLSTLNRGRPTTGLSLMLLLSHLSSCSGLRDDLLLLVLSHLLRRVLLALLLHLLLAQQLGILLRTRRIRDAVGLCLLLRGISSSGVHCVLSHVILSLLHGRSREQLLIANQGGLPNCRWGLVWVLHPDLILELCEVCLHAGRQTSRLLCEARRWRTGWPVVHVHSDTTGRSSHSHAVGCVTRHVVHHEVVLVDAIHAVANSSRVGLGRRPIWHGVVLVVLRGWLSLDLGRRVLRRHLLCLLLRGGLLLLRVMMTLNLALGLLLSSLLASLLVLDPSSLHH